ncbi:MAG: ShlB/FhaC/HecB family hemolysin secretion/activation protein [Pseudomonadota bacterium]
MKCAARVFPLSKAAALRLAAAILIAASAGVAIAQTASQVTERDFAPPPQRLQGALVFSGEAGLAAPPGSENLSIAISDVVVEGTLPELRVPTEALRQRLTRGRIAASELFEAASELEQAYVNEGFVLARVVLPAQELRDGGVLRLNVVNGFVEAIDASNVPEAIRPRLEVLTEPLVGQQGLRLRELERRILLAGDTYGVALGSALQAGAQPGGTVIILDPEYRGVTGFVGFDNSLSDSLGNYKVDTGVEANGLLGFGESIYGRLSFHPDEDLFDDPRLLTASLGAVVPLGSEGLTFNLEGTNSQTNSQGDGPDLPSDFTRVSARLFYPWVRSRTFNLTTQLAFDMQDDKLEIDTPAGTETIYEDRLRILRASADAFWLFENGGALELGGELSVGLDGFGARNASDVDDDDAPLSREGTDADFTKFQVTGRYRAPIADSFLLTVNGRMQTSFGDPLAIAEQMGLASARELSPLDAGTLTGDSGWVLRGEIARPFTMSASDRPLTLSPYAFAATGAVFREEPSEDEEDETSASAFGIGLDVFYEIEPRFSSTSIRIEYGRGTRNDDVDDTDSLSIAANYRF